jgi:HD-GYP domain-containing protein (c-di-GMP phosphodiesterase class II)
MSMKSGKMDKWDAVPFPSRFLVPGGLHAISRRTTWIVEALAHYECMGYILIQLGTKNYKTYGEIRRIVSSTLQGTRLFVQAREQNENLKRQSETLKGSLERMHQLIGGVINTLSLTLETRDPYTAGHQRRVSDLARSISTELSMSADEIESIRLSASVHDLGKIYVPSEILNKPGKLREAEMHLIQLHPQIAFDILKTIEFPWPIGEIVLQHHERMDGSGYPQGLTGDRITAAARIISVADVVEAMASHRPYRASLGLDAALEEIERFRGVHYDADAVDACLKLFRSKGYMFR